MKLVNLTCPNCGGALERVGDNLCCKSCGGAFAIDYDDSDVEYEKLQTEDERAQREFEHEKELLEIRHRQEEEARIAAEKREYKRVKKEQFGKKVSSQFGCLIALLIMAGFFYGSYRLMVSSGIMPSFKEMIESARATSRDPYDIDASDVTDEMLDNMIDSAQKAKIKSRHGVRELVKNKWVDYSLESVEFDSAYLINKATDGHNRVVIIFKLHYKSKNGEKITYDGTYFQGLRRGQDGKVAGNYDPRTVSRSKAAWNSDSYEDKDVCYRENVLAFGGQVTELHLNKTVQSEG